MYFQIARVAVPNNHFYLKLKYLLQIIFVFLQLFNSEDGIGSYDMPALTNATGAPSPDTNVGISEYAPDVDLSELLQMPANGKTILQFRS